MCDRAMPEKAPRWKLLFAYLSLYIIWGSTYLGIRFTVETIPPFLSGGMRFLAAGALLFSARWCLHRRMPSLRCWWKALWTSLLPFVVAYGLITPAERHVSSSVAAVIMATEPAFFCLIGWLCFRGARPTAKTYTAMALGFTGVCILIMGDPAADLSIKSGSLIWLLMLLAAALAWVFGAFFAAEPGIDSDPQTASAMQMLCGGAVMMALQYSWSFYTGSYPVLSSFSSRSLLALLYLIIFGSIVGYTSFLWLMRVEPADRVSTYAFVNPLVAVLLGLSLGNETLHDNLWFALPLIITSVALTNYDQKKQRVPD